MISDQHALDAVSNHATAGNGRTQPARTSVALLAAALQRASGVAMAFVKIPVLPYAALWAAAVVARRHTEQEFFEPDPFGSEGSFLSDSWPADTR